MSKVSTDPQLIEEFLTRGVEKIYPTTEELRKKLQSGDRLKVYQGFDPTGPYLHVGHAIGIRSMRILQQLGHEVIFLIGDFTARIGDPDKDKTRELLTTEKIEANMRGWIEQAKQLIDFEGENPVKFVYNNDWLSKLTLEELIHLMSQMTVQQMLERDMFEKRYNANQPIQLQEFIYPLMQGYDSVAMNIDIEVCGADQTFNALTGRHLVKNYLEKEKFVRANKMMDAPDGITMSKTKGNGINLSDSAEDMYGKAMRYSDEHIAMGFEMLTSIPMSEIEEIKQAINGGENPMQFKKQMAFEIVKEIKGEEAARKGEAYFQNTVQDKEVPDDIATVTITSGSTLIDVIVDQGLVPSKGEAKRLIEQGGVQIDGEKVSDKNYVLDTTSGKKLIKAGKRKFLYVV